MVHVLRSWSTAELLSGVALDALRNRAGELRRPRLRCVHCEKTVLLKDEQRNTLQDNHPNAMALSVLVTIEMLNAMNRCESAHGDTKTKRTLQSVGEPIAHRHAALDEHVVDGRDGIVDVAALRHPLR